MKSKNNWKSQEQAKLFSRLGQLLEKGYSLPTALEFIMLNESELRKKDLQRMIESLKQGMPLYQVFLDWQFANDGLSYLYFAEKYGELANGLVSAGEMMAKKEQYKKKIARLIRYPLLLIFFISLLLTIMQQMIIPQFMELYQSMNLPPSTIILFIMYCKTLFSNVIAIFCIMIIALFAYYGIIFRQKSPLEKHIFLCKFPLFRFFIRKYVTYFFSFHIGNLLTAGFSINDAITIFTEQNHILFFKAEARRIRTLLLEGTNLEKILQATPYYEPELATVIVHGQANSMLAKELLDYSKLILDEAETKMTFWLRIFQPTLIMMIGVGVFLMYLAIMLPLFQMIQTF